MSIHGASPATLIALLLAIPLEASAGAGDVSLGFGAALAMDLPDPASAEHTRFGPGPSIQIPLRIGLTSHANLRINGRADLGIGRDRVSWAHWIDGESVRFYNDGHFAMLLAAGLTAGPEVVFPIEGAMKPYLGAGVGAAWVGTYHSLDGPARNLLDPMQNDLEDPRNIDPYTSQLALLTDVTLGAMTSGKTSLWVELGYSNAWVGGRALTKTIAEMDARREAYGWNAARAAVGVQFGL